MHKTCKIIRDYLDVYKYRTANDSDNKTLLRVRGPQSLEESFRLSEAEAFKYFKTPILKTAAGVFGLQKYFKATGEVPNNYYRRSSCDSIII